MNYIHSYYQDLLAGSFFTPQDPRFQNGTYPTRVPSYTTFDLFGRYNITPNFSVRHRFSISSIAQPPYDPGIDATELLRLHTIRCSRDDLPRGHKLQVPLAQPLNC